MIIFCHIYIYLFAQQGDVASTEILKTSLSEHNRDYRKAIPFIM